MPMPRLTNDETQLALQTLPGWTCDGRALARTYTLPSFADAMAFVNRLATYAETVDHHPDMQIAYRTVTVRWWTHDVGGVTAKDLEGARATDAALTGTSRQSPR